MKTTQLRERILSGKLDERLLAIYCDPSRLDYQRGRYAALIDEFEQHFGQADVMILSVPGRSEITGNHTDHQRGSVLACSLNIDMIAVVCPDDNLTVYSGGTLIKDLDINDLEYNPDQEGTSTALVKGIMFRLKELGYQVGGMKAVITSDVLVGSGISSSAAFEDMIGTIISHLYNGGSINKVEIAKAAQYSENKFFGKPCGLMDQCACALGGIVYIDFDNPEKPIIRQVDVDFNHFGYSLCIVNTGGSHSNLTGDYSSITKEMKQIARYFHKRVLRHVSKEDIIAHAATLRERYGDRSVLRALHMLNEQERVIRQLKNLERDDFEAFLKTIKESGDSSYKYLQNVFTTKTPKYQPISLGILLSEEILGDNGVVRVHGGGFAGTIQVFVKNDFVTLYKTEIEKVFGKDSCMVLQVNNEGATRVI